MATSANLAGQKNDAIRIAILSHCPPLPSWGGSMTFYRHFVERPDFAPLVITTSKHVAGYTLPYSPVTISLPRAWKRFLNSRFHSSAYGMQCLIGARFLPKLAINTARRFNPEAIFTVAGSWDWTTLAAQRLAAVLGLPLIASFNDWFDYGAFPAHKYFRPPVERRFRRFYRESDLALCTCEGMRDALGKHPNVHVLYPTGATPVPSPVMCRPERRNTVVLFAGTLGGWYSRMVESLLVASWSTFPDIEFRVFGALQNWSEEFQQRAVDNGTFRGLIPFDRLQVEARDADILLLPVGFDDSCALAEKTSFKTKFLDYLSFQRPIVVWGPEYSSAVRAAREFDSAECVTDASPSSCAAAISLLARSPNRRDQLIQNAAHMYRSRYNPDLIHSGLVNQVRSLLRRT